MPSAIFKCRVCGKEYEACRSLNRAIGVFRWQEVACSPECGSIYLKQINESRGIFEPEEKKEEAPAEPAFSDMESKQPKQTRKRVVKSHNCEDSENTISE